jgi:multiple sugar transport system ATP-binding protein
VRPDTKHLHLQLRTTTVFVTHDQEEAMSRSDKMDEPRQARAIYGTPAEIYHRPNNVYVGTFIGKPRMSVVESSCRRTARCCFGRLAYG